MPQPGKKTFLFVDDSPDFLEVAREVFTELSKGGWRIFTAANHAEALNLMGRQRFDMLVLDVDMPVMDGIQFLQLVLRAHPGQQVVMLSGHTDAERRRKCLDSGAVMFLEKLLTPDGYASAYAALDALATTPSAAGFHGMMRRVGLQEVIQLECLGRKSSILEVFTKGLRGRVFVCDGTIVHAETNHMRGEMALYNLLALTGGGFNLLSYVEPQERTISGQWEFLLMEAARLSDEGALTGLLESSAGPESDMVAANPTGLTGNRRIIEMVLCSGSGELLHSWQTDAPSRIALLRAIEVHGQKISALAPVGRLEQVETLGEDCRTICQARMDRFLLVTCRTEREEAQ